MEMPESHETLSLFEAELMSSVPVSRANLQVWQESGKAQAMLAGSGRQLSMLLNQSTPLGAFSKILLESSAFGNSKQYSYVWTRLDTKFGCSAFQLTPLAQITLDTGYSLWPTPDAKLSDSGPDYARSNRTGLGGDDLTTRIHKLCPTATATDAKASLNATANRNPGSKHHSGTTLTDAAKLWPTPTVPNGGRRNPPGTSITGQKPDGGKAQIDIREFAIRMLPTPTTRDYKDGTAESCQNVPVNGLLGRAVHQIDQLPSGSLNPQFVCQLMGYPEDWTQIK